MTQYYTFKDSDLPTSTLIGGKALSLLQSKQQGFNVPAAVVLSTEFFQPWMDQVKSSPQWKAFTKARGADLKSAAAALKNICQTLDFTETQGKTLTEVRQHLQAEGITLMAVRSSSPEEDLEGASFAGIYETVLGVKDERLETAIRTCFSSALDERVAAYKHKSGFDPYDPSIAVIIQKQIASEVSGVAFSLNPVSNCFDECLINANFGLGVTVVDGSVTPDEFVVDKVANTIIKKTIGKKDTALYLKADGGIESKPPASAADFCLSDEQILDVSALATRVENIYGKPMDIEWAYQGDQVHLLQARPITAYFKLPAEMITQPGQQKNIYQDALLSEQGLAESLSPLGIDVFLSFSEEMLPGEPAPGFTTIEQGMAFGSMGRMYTHIGRMLKIMGKNSVIKTYRLVDDRGTRILDTMDLKEYIPKKLPKGFLKNLIITGLGSVMYLKPLLKARAKPEEYLQYYQDGNANLRQALKAEFERDNSFAELSTVTSRKCGYHMNTVQLPALMVSETARGNLKKLFKKDPRSVQEHLVYVERSLPGNVTIEMSLLLYELSQFPEVRETDNARDFVQKLENNQFSVEFMQKWQLFSNDYGFRGPKELDIATPRYYEKPGEVFALLKTMQSHDDPSLTPQGIFEHGAKQRIESVHFLEEYLQRNRPGKVRTFRKNYKLLETFGAYRESPKYYIIMVIDYLRRRALRIGRQWMQDGRLDSFEHIFDLRLDEFLQAEKDPNLDIRKLAATNRDYFSQFNRNNDPPILIDSRGFIPKLPPTKRKGNELEGTPVSAGTVRGFVKVLRTPGEKAILPGDILVTKATDPGWTTLFINAVGVLLESGGALQHGASVAREMGKPCIVGIEDVTKILKDGQMVELNGSTGVIQILNSVASDQT